MSTPPAMPATEDADKVRREYVEKQVVPWLIAHLQMRSTGLQVFVAIQGALLYAFAATSHWALPVIGLTGCLSFGLWDARNRDVFTRLHALAEVIVDRPLFGVADDGYAKDGFHVQALGTLSRSGTLNPQVARTSGLVSHTWAIRIMIYTAAFIWLVELAVLVWRFYDKSSA
jgi:hypothetical protein